jgi:hypothetical protein
MATAKKNTSVTFLHAYRQTPGTTGTIRRSDRMLAAHLYERGVSVTVVENALVLGAARRLIRPPGAMPLATVRSLAYFLPVIEELLERPVCSNYFDYLRRKLAQMESSR